MRILEPNTFKKNVFKLATGTLISQIITLLSAPIITTIYGAQNFGIMLIFTSISAIFIPVVNMRYELSIILPRKKSESSNLFILSVFISLFFSFLLLLVILFFGDQLFILFNINNLKSYKWLIPLTIFLAGVTSSCNYWCTRNKYFSQISIAQILTQLFVSIGGVCFGLLGHNNSITLITIGILGQLLNLLLLGGKIVISKDLNFIFLSVNIRKIIDLAIRHKNFPKFSTLGALLNSASWQAPIIILGFFFPPAIVGFYGLGFRLIQMPMSLLGNSINQVFLQHGAQKKHEGNLGQDVEKLFILLFSLGLIPNLILMILGASLFELFFGIGWREAGIYVQMLVPWAFLWFLSSPLSPIYSIQEQQKMELKMHSVIFFTRVISLLIGGLYGNARIAILLFSIGGIISYGYLLLQVFKMAELELKYIVNKVFNEFIKSLIYVLPLLVIKLIFNNNLLLIFAGLISFLIVAYQKYNLLKLQKYV